MKYIAVKESTKEVFSFNGAYKIADFIGIHHVTIYRNAQRRISDKIYKGYRIAKPENNPIPYENRGGELVK